MNLSYRWLQSLSPDLVESPGEVAERLAMAGAPVDELVDLSQPLRDVQVAHVLEVRPHPAADRLSVCLVDAGTGTPVQVVCGAPNVRPGRDYPYVPVGASLPGAGSIRKVRIRGQESQGMLCSPRELALGRDHDGLLDLQGQYTPGSSFVDAVGLADTRLVVDVTPNRPDLLSHFGVARELSQTGSKALRLPSFAEAAQRAASTLAFAGGRVAGAADGFPVAVQDFTGCPRYLGVVIRGVHVGPSPDWLGARLRAIGQRPINNVVDATNYVLHELGQPLHAFDLARLSGGIMVRRAKPGEAMVTLDGERRRFTPAMLLITDQDGAVAVAGVMGGESAEVREATRDVFLECALFDPRSVRATRRELGLSTDASYRFERGVDPDGMERAARRAVELILATSGGEVAATTADVRTEPTPPVVVRLRPERVRKILGVDLSASRIGGYLESLDFPIMGEDGDALTVRVPGHRSYDVAREADLVEEVARRHGYDRFPDELRAFRPSAVPEDPMSRVEARLRTRLTALGFLEARSSPFAPEAEGDVVLLHPLSTEESRLRNSLLMGLLHRLEGNFARGVRDVRLFEVGTVFAPATGAGRPLEWTHVAGVLTGSRTPPHWSGAAEEFDVWDLKGILTEVATEVGATLLDGGTIPGHGALLEETRSFGVVWKGETIGAGGAVRSEAVDAPAWAASVWAFEVRLEPAMAEPAARIFQTLPAFPAVERDLALVLPMALGATTVVETIRKAAGPLLEEVAPFDVYTGKGIPDDARSVAFRLRFRDPERTLKDSEVDGFVARVLEQLKEKHHVERRS